MISLLRTLWVLAAVTLRRAMARDVLINLLLLDVGRRGLRTILRSFNFFALAFFILRSITCPVIFPIPYFEGNDEARPFEIDWAAFFYLPIPTRWPTWKTLPSVCIDGAMIISTSCICWMFETPREPIEVLSAPIRFCEPSSTLAGPKRISFNVPVVLTCTRVPLGKLACEVAMPQWYPRPGASCARAKDDPTKTASANEAQG